MSVFVPPYPSPWQLGQFTAPANYEACHWDPGIAISRDRSGTAVAVIVVTRARGAWGTVGAVHRSGDALGKRAERSPPGTLRNGPPALMIGACGEMGLPAGVESELDRSTPVCFQRKFLKFGL